MREWAAGPEGLDAAGPPSPRPRGDAMSKRARKRRDRKKKAANHGRKPNA
ncbi:hypothetical protein MWU75_03090 [Ornithinimicrobium sp. F0845]|nr:hypothetical protein [Ornithinimicrobium sp. F0845]MCK0111126.1 hypothetical protein [Ornithinimicrobium sp. F0845]